MQIDTCELGAGTAYCTGRGEILEPCAALDESHAALFVSRHSVLSTVIVIWSILNLSFERERERERLVGVDWRRDERRIESSRDASSRVVRLLRRL